MNSAAGSLHRATAAGSAIRQADASRLGGFDGAADTRRQKISSDVGIAGLVRRAWLVDDIGGAASAWGRRSSGDRSPACGDLPGCRRQRRQSRQGEPAPDSAQEAMPRTGAIWLSPAGVGKEIVITGANSPDTASVPADNAVRSVERRFQPSGRTGPFDPSCRRHRRRCH